MTKLRVIIVMGFVVAFAAGLVLGLVRGRQEAQARPAGAASATQPTTRRMSFAQALGLSADQDAKVRQWREEAFREAMREVEERRVALRKQRDDAILPMLTAENRLVYETVMQEYTAAMGQVDSQRPRAFERLDEQIKSILDGQQLVKFEDMQKRRADERRRHELNRRGESATTRPATTNPSH